MKNPGLPFYKSLFAGLLVPVILMGGVVCTFLILLLFPPMASYLNSQADAHLRLASELGIEICDSRFDYLLELRLEEDPEMDRALRSEALQEIKALSGRLFDVEMVVLDSTHRILISSLEPDTGGNLPEAWDVSEWEPGDDKIREMEFLGQKVRSHLRYFPYWDWIVVGVISEKDFERPIVTAGQIIFLTTIGVFAALCLTLFFSYRRSIRLPLKRLIEATRGVSRGRMEKISGTPENEFGQLVQSFNVMIDSLDHEKAEVSRLISRLKLSEQRFHTLFENAPLGMCVVLSDGIIIEKNDELREIIEKGSASLENQRNFYTLFGSSKDRELFRDSIRQQGWADNFECIFRRANGTACDVRLKAAEISWNQDQALVVTVEDITGLRDLEVQLRQTRKMEAVGRLAGGIAHDINNLLMPIMGYAEMLLDDMPRGNPLRDSAEEIMTASIRARDIISQLLAFSRKQTLNYSPVNLNEVIEGFRKLLRHALRENIGIRIIPGVGIPPVLADTGQIEQVLMNLSVNAQDAMPDGGILTIETSATLRNEFYPETRLSEKSGRYAVINITDTGQGMDEETRQKIFEPFFSTKKEQGTGLGLATVYGIVRQHGGDIEVFSNYGEGTTFRISLPATDRIRPAAEQKSVTADSLEGKETILLAEDNEQVRNLAGKILSKLGYNVLTACGGAEALTLISSFEGPVHLLLTDVIMPGMNGRQLYNHISEILPGIRVLYMSGYTDDIIAGYGVPAPGIEFIAKPFSAKSLALKVRSILDWTDR